MSSRSMRSPTGLREGGKGTGKKEITTFHSRCPDHYTAKTTTEGMEGGKGGKKEGGGVFESLHRS